MRLFSAGTFYLSRSSSLAAEYICDRDTIKQHRDTGLLLSTVIQMQIMERDTELYPPDLSVYDTCEDVCDWLHASAHNVAWVVDYFEHLDVKCCKLFEMKPLTWTFKRKLRSYIDVFDMCETDDAWLPMLPSQARTEYASEVRRYQYRKVKIPFWLTTSLLHTSHAQAEQKPATTCTGGEAGQPADVIVTADGATLDLSPLW